MLGALLLAAAMLASPLATKTNVATSTDALKALPAPHTEVIGQSARGRPIRATRIGDGPVAVLVVGCLH